MIVIDDLRKVNMWRAKWSIRCFEDNVRGFGYDSYEEIPKKCFEGSTSFFYLMAYKIDKYVVFDICDEMF